MPGRRLVWVVLVAAVMGGLAAWAWSGSPPTGAGAIHVLKVEGAPVCYNYSLSPFTRMVAVEGKRPAGLLARAGDLLVFNKADPQDDSAWMFMYRDGDGDALVVALEPGRLVVGSKTVMLDLEEASAWDWLRKASAEDRRGVRVLAATDPGDPARAALLKEFARVNPGIGLWLKAAKPDAKGQPAEGQPPPPAPDPAVAAGDGPPPFRPGYLLLEEPADLLEAARSDVPAFQDVTHVVVLGGTVTAQQALGLAHLPRLQSVTLLNWPFAKGETPVGLRSLRALSIALGAMELTDLAPVADLEGLTELVVTGANVNDLSPLAKLKGLKVLSLAWCAGVTDLAPLKGLPLEFLSLPPKVSQQEFEAVVKAHPGLEAVEMLGCENIKDVACLKDLKRLKAVVAISADDDKGLLPAGLKDLKGLRLLVLPENVFTKTPDQIAAVEKALPNTLVTGGKGICLGSGWILALVPAVIAAWAVGRRRRRRRPDAQVSPTRFQPSQPKRLLRRSRLRVAP